MPRANTDRSNRDVAYQNTQAVVREIQSRAHREPITRYPPKTLRELEREAADLGDLVELVVILVAAVVAGWLAWVVLG